MSQSELRAALAVAEKIKASGQNCPEYGTNAGCGHVWKRPDGIRARCGGPGLCKKCAADKQRCGGYQPSAQELSVIADALISRATADRGGVEPSDPLTIIAGIRQFGLAADGSDLRDLEAAIARIRSALATTTE